MPVESQKIDAITFPADCCVLARFGAIPLGPTHCFACCFDSGVYWGIHVLSMVTNGSKKLPGLRFKRSKQLLASRTHWPF